MDLMRVGQVAEAFDVHPRTVRRWLKRGQLPFVRMPGGERRVPADAIVQVLGLQQHDENATVSARRPTSFSLETEWRTVERTHSWDELWRRVSQVLLTLSVDRP